MKLLHFALCSLNLNFLHSLIIGVDDFIYHISSMLCVCVCVWGGGCELQFTRSTNGILKINLEGLKASLGRIWLLFGRKSAIRNRDQFLKETICSLRRESFHLGIHLC